MLNTVGRLQDSIHKLFEDDQSLFEHPDIFICYVDQLQRQVGYDSGADESLYQVFEKGNRRMLNEFSELPQTSELSDTCLEDCLGEYEAIDAISLTTKQIKTYCRILLHDDS